MKAKRVKDLEPSETLADNAEKIIRVRLDELHSFVPKALDPQEQDALHDMRIAAKRLRYLLELTSFAFGDYAEKGAKQAKDLQDLLGEIHDCDEQLPRVLSHIADLRSRDAAVLRVLAGGDAKDMPPSLTARAPHRDAYRGLEALAIFLEARRGLLFERFLEEWDVLERKDFRGQLREALAERPEPDPEESSPGPHTDEVQHELRTLPGG